jgi:hypothetical protein
MFMVVVVVEQKALRVIQGQQDCAHAVKPISQVVTVVVVLVAMVVGVALVAHLVVDAVVERVDAVKLNMRHNVKELYLIQNQVLLVVKVAMVLQVVDGITLMAH